MRWFAKSAPKVMGDLSDSGATAPVSGHGPGADAVSQASGPAGRTTRRFRGWRGWLLRLGLCVLSPTLFFGLLETGLRLGGYGYSTKFFLGPDAHGAYTTNPRFGWRFFPRSLAQDPHPCTLAAKPAGSIRIFVLGSSAAMGTPDPAFNFGRILAVMLREQYPDVRFEIVNAAMTAINSHAVVEIARDCAARQPDLFVVYTGNNEVIGPFGPETVFQHGRIIRASLWVKSTRVGQWLGNTLARFRRHQDAPRYWRGMETFLNNPVTADDPRLKAVYDNYRRNLTDICDTARRAGIGVVLSTVAVNLRDCPPLASSHRSGLTPDDLAKWESLYKAGGELEAGNHITEALDPYEAAAMIDERFAELQFCIARCLMKTGRSAEARERFELARDLDVLRFRADSRINAVVSEVANEKQAAGVRFVDAGQKLAQSDPGSQGIPGGGLFYEHVHLTFDGNYALARAVFDQVCESLPQLSSSKKQGVMPSRQRCAELLALTPWDEHQLVASIVKMTSKKPFTGQLDHDLRQTQASQQMEELRNQASTPQAIQEAWKTYAAALATDPYDWSLHYHFGMLAMQHGRSDVAVEHLQIAVLKVPGVSYIHDNLGSALSACGRTDEAVVHYRKALDIKPDSPNVHFNLGLTLAERGQLGEAITHYRRALEINPDFAEVHNSLAISLLGSGQVEEAIVHFQKALEINPDLADAHFKLGNVLVGRGHVEQAIVHYQKALGIKPDSADARNLGPVLLQQGRVDEAIAYYRKTLEIKPGSAETHNYLAIALAGRGQMDDAIAHHQKALEIKPDFAEAHINLGVALASRRQLDEAIAHYQKALEITPNSAEAHLNLGNAMNSRRQVDEAIDHLQKAVAIRPDFAEAHNNLGVALAGCGRVDEAIIHLQKAVEIKPDYVDARRNLEILRAKRTKAKGTEPDPNKK
jgi:tetratricopeptide (TPR) repeat protein